MILEGTFDGKIVRITYDGEDKPCHLTIHFLPPIDMDVDRGEFQNTKGLSAHLRSEIGYKECCELLFAHNIPKDSGLWSLNHDGYPSDHFVQQFFPEHGPIECGCDQWHCLTCSPDRRTL